MATNTPQDEFHKTGVRMPKDVHAKLHEAAASSGRSYNAEIVSRLQNSFEPSAESIPPLVKSAIEDEIEERGGSVADALTRLVTMGQVCGGTMLFATIGPKTTTKQFLQMLESSKTVIPPDTSLVLEHKPVK